LAAEKMSISGRVGGTIGSELVSKVDAFMFFPIR
jgi:hypothetical protein